MLSNSIIVHYFFKVTIVLSFSVFISCLPNTIHAAATSEANETTGIGISIGMIDDQLKVITVMPDSPAERKGLPV